MQSLSKWNSLVTFTLNHLECEKDEDCVGTTGQVKCETCKCSKGEPNPEPSSARPGKIILIAYHYPINIKHKTQMWYDIFIFDVIL